MNDTPPSPPKAAPDDAPPDPGPSVSGWHVVWSLLISLGVLAVIGYFTFDPSAARTAIQNASPLLLTAALGMALIRIGVGGWRLSYVSQGRLSLMAGIRGQLAWYFFANVTPTVVGGGPVAPFYIARDEGIPVGEAAAFTFFCMLLNQLWFVVAVPVIAGIGMPLGLLPEVGGGWTGPALLLSFAALFLWGLVFAYFTLVRPRRLVELADVVLRWPVLRRFHETGMRQMRSYYRRARRLGGQAPSFYGWGFFLTALIWLSRYAVAFLVVYSLHATEPLLLYLRSAATMMVGLLMPTPGGSGGLEGLYAFFVGPLMPAFLMAPTLFLWRFLDGYLFIGLGSYLFLPRTGSTARQPEA